MFVRGLTLAALSAEESEAGCGCLALGPVVWTRLLLASG